LAATSSRSFGNSAFGHAEGLAELLVELRQRRLLDAFDGDFENRALPASSVAR
jgi:hypothetical protein